ncbi:MAG: threonine--tRNA ligase [Solirubrobacterales bacterium]
MKVRLPDNSEREVADGSSGRDLAEAIGPGLAKAALAIKSDGELRDLSAPLTDGAQVEVVTDRSPEALELIRHDAAHVMAEAVLDLYPGTKISIGPPIDSGFYYDFEFPDGVKVTDEDLARIEKQMGEHIAADEAFERADLSTDDALERFEREGQDYKVELIRDLISNEAVETVSLYSNGAFTDLCRGPHAPSTGRIKTFKLLSLAGAYWRGDESNTMLTRIYGTAFLSKKDLEQHLELLEQARARDHRKLGPQLGLFLFRSESPGMPFWLPNGMVVINEITGLVREHLERDGYEEIKTPQLLDEQLWHRSGHWDNYRDNMFFTESEHKRFAVKPMNCPGACLVFGSQRHSYRELPLRLAEFGLVTRDEREGVLHGLLRVRAFTQDDAHIYCTEEQIVDEVRKIVESIDELYATFGFDQVRVELSTKPDKAIGADRQWELAETALKQALADMGREHQLNPGDGAFYGPKIDFHVTDALGRSWQLGTCQLDFFMPERFELRYTDADDTSRTPVMIHRALLGSIERFVGILTEHHAGNFPTWLAPTQAIVLPIADRHVDQARSARMDLRRASVRCGIDERAESIGKKIRDAEIRKIPYMLVVGDAEQESSQLSVRRHGEGDIGLMDTATVADLINDA